MKQRGKNNWSPIPSVASARRDERESRESRPGGETMLMLPSFTFTLICHLICDQECYCVEYHFTM